MEGDDHGEAYTVIVWGVGLSHERSDIAGAEGFHSLEGNMCGTVIARCGRPAGVEGHITCKGIAPEAGRSRVWPPSPTTMQHSLPGARYGLPAPVFHRLDRASFPGAQAISIAVAPL